VNPPVLKRADAKSAPVMEGATGWSSEATLEALRFEVESLRRQVVAGRKEREFVVTRYEQQLSVRGPPPRPDHLVPAHLVPAHLVPAHLVPAHLVPAHRDVNVVNRTNRHSGWEMSSRGRFTTPTDSLRQDWSPY
jgi:hypothetical protein